MLKFRYLAARDLVNTGPGSGLLPNDTYSSFQPPLTQLQLNLSKQTETWYLNQIEQYFFRLGAFEYIVYNCLPFLSGLNVPAASSGLSYGLSLPLELGRRRVAITNCNKSRDYFYDPLSDINVIFVAQLLLGCWRIWVDCCFLRKVHRNGLSVMPVLCSLLGCMVNRMVWSCTSDNLEWIKTQARTRHSPDMNLVGMVRVFIAISLIFYYLINI